MQYGFFDRKAREYIITQPKTPAKWINYIGTMEFGGYIDHTGGALICKGDPALNRITRYLNLLPAGDFRGETLYLRVTTPSETQIISPLFVPCLTPYERFECHVGLGYSRILSEMRGIRTEVTIFVPMDAPCEVREVKITYLRAERVEIDAIPVVEYTHFDALKQLTNADWVPQTMQSWLAEDDGGMKTLAQAAFMKRESAVNFFTSNLPASSFETDRREFLGDWEYGTWAHPLSLGQRELGMHEARRGDNIAALMHHLGVFQPGETRTLVTLLTQAPSLEEVHHLFRQYRQPGAVQSAFQDLANFWENYLSRQQVRTPDPDLDIMLNVYNPYQCFVTKTWSRYLSYYQLGYGARGIGFRDSSQDVMGILACAPQEARPLIIKLLRVQKQNGSAMHQFNPLTMEATAGDALEREDRPHYYSDDALWIVLAVTAYLKESGDWTFLDEVVPFYEKDRQGLALENGTILEHLRRAVAFTRKDVGRHGLPLLGFADWNDTINLPAGAESLLTACLYGRALLEMNELCSYLDLEEEAGKYRQWYQVVKVLVNLHAWDGDWYLSYFDADGTPLGSHHNSAGQIFAYSQAWMVMAGFAEPERAALALESVYQRLNTQQGIKLSTPGFNSFDPQKGGVTTYPPGAKENGGIFLHINPWVIIGETLIGNGDRAYEYTMQINPARKNERIDEYECEPYVYPQNILGDEHPQFGLARNSWLSGTASWMYQAGTQYLLGIRPVFDGLMVDPCIPSSWETFQVVREFRGARYAISVRNPSHISHGVKTVVLDGVLIQGNRIPTLNDGKTHQVVVTLEPD